MRTKVEELFFCKNTMQWQYALAEKPEIVKWQTGNIVATKH